MSYYGSVATQLFLYELCTYLTDFWSTEQLPYRRQIAQTSVLMSSRDMQSQYDYSCAYNSSLNNIIFLHDVICYSVQKAQYGMSDTVTLLLLVHNILFYCLSLFSEEYYLILNGPWLTWSLYFPVCVMVKPYLFPNPHTLTILTIIS